VDRRRRHSPDPQKDREERDALYRALAAGELSVGQAVARLRALTRLTQPEFARHRGISLDALRQIETGRGNPTVETLAKVVAVFGLQVGFVPKRRQAETFALAEPGSKARSEPP